MSKRQYLRALNAEIQKLNGIIDLKILHDRDYHREALRHKQLLREIRREETPRSLAFFARPLKTSWF